MPNNNKLKLFEVDDMGIWNNFKSITYILEELKDEIKALNHTVKEQQKQIMRIYNGLESRVEEKEHEQFPDVPMPKWLKHSEVVKHG